MEFFLLNSIQESWSMKFCFSGRFVTLKYINYIVFEYFVKKLMVCGDGTSMFAMKFRHATGITQMNPNHGLLSDKCDLPSQFADYGLV